MIENSACPYRVGDEIAFAPSAFDGFAEAKGYLCTLRGRVVHVNDEHRHYTAEAVCNGCIIRESFKF